MKTKIVIKGTDIGRPAERPPKTDWKIELLKKILKLFQYISPQKSAKVVWHYFTMPGGVRFSEPQKKILTTAAVCETSYRGDTIKSYKWGNGEKKVLICHGWRSKTADFRKMIDLLHHSGYTVEGIDMRAHGHSEGKHTALPEFRDMIKGHISKNGPYEAVIGHSLGAISSGIALSELPKEFLPKHFFIIAAPPYMSYFFDDLIKEVGLNDNVLKYMYGLVKTTYHEELDYFDLRSKNKGDNLKQVDTHLIYCEDDQVIPFAKGLELESAWPHASFVHVKGLGHYKIIANEEIIQYIKDTVEK